MVLPHAQRVVNVRLVDSPPTPKTPPPRPHTPAPRCRRRAGARRRRESPAATASLSTSAPGLGDQVAEGGECHQLAGVKRSAKVVIAVVGRLEVPGVVRKGRHPVSTLAPPKPPLGRAPRWGAGRCGLADPQPSMAMSRAPMRPALPSARMWSKGTARIADDAEAPRRLTVPSWGRSLPRPHSKRTVFGRRTGIHDGLHPGLLTLLWWKEPTCLVSGISAPQAGLGHVTVRAHPSQAMTVASPPPCSLGKSHLGDRGGRAPHGLVRASRLRSDAHRPPVPERRAMVPAMGILFASGWTGGLPANLGGISMSALVMSTATGLRSLP